MTGYRASPGTTIVRLWTQPSRLSPAVHSALDGAGVDGETARIALSVRNTGAYVVLDAGADLFFCLRLPIALRSSLESYIPPRAAMTAAHARRPTSI